MSVVVPIAISLGFGWLLQRAGLSRYDRIAGLYRLKDLAVLEFMLAALATAALGIVILQALGGAGEVPIPVTPIGAALIGGMIFGVGMAWSGFCPGTVGSGIGEGRLDYLIPGSLGLVAGSIGYGLAWPAIAPSLARIGNVGANTIPSLLGVAPWLVVLLLAELVVGVLYLALRRSPQQS